MIIINLKNEMKKLKEVVKNFCSKELLLHSSKFQTNFYVLSLASNNSKKKCSINHLVNIVLYAPFVRRTGYDSLDIITHCLKGFSYT